MQSPRYLGPVLKELFIGQESRWIETLTHPPKSQALQGWVAGTVGPCTHSGHQTAHTPSEEASQGQRGGSYKQPRQVFGHCTLSLGHQAIKHSMFQSSKPHSLQYFSSTSRLQGCQWTGRVLRGWAHLLPAAALQPLTSGSMLSCSLGAWASGGGIVMDRLGGFRLCRRLPDTEERLLPSLSAEAMVDTMARRETRRSAQSWQD